MTAIPDFVVEFFLLGRTRRQAVERYTQDGGIVSDVWLAFARDVDAPQRVLLSPTRGTSAGDLGYALHTAVRSYRSKLPPGASPEASRGSPGVSPLEAFVVANLYFDELLRIVLPMTTWWRDKGLSALYRKARGSGRQLDEMLEEAIRRKLMVDTGAGDGDDLSLRKELASLAPEYPDARLLEAVSLAAVIGVFSAARARSDFLAGLEGVNAHTHEGLNQFIEWVKSHAEEIAMAARRELQNVQIGELRGLEPSQYVPGSYPPRIPGDPPVLVQRVFRDREASLAGAIAISTIKADAAFRVFDISCRDVAWAVIDSGIAAAHPAFADHEAKDAAGSPDPTRTRIKATYDFTRIERIRGFNLITDADGSPERRATIEAVADELASLPGRLTSPGFRDTAIANLEAIARQLDRRTTPDWSLVEPLIRWEDRGDGAHLTSDHGTHVAGTLAGDWRRRQGSTDAADAVLRGVCPDLSLYDLRVIHPRDRRSSEFAVIAALEFVQFLNSRAGSDGAVIHGVNVSMSIPHDVRNYGCGATPVCAASDRLVNSGVVVVAAAGNRGWNEPEPGFGNFVFCSITDPGNAREVITVGSTHRAKPHTYGVSYFSSRGPTGDGRVKPDLVAPGEQIRGPIRGDSDDEFDGTSMAAPFVSGAAAMLLARHRELLGNPRRVKQILCDSATDLGRERYFQGCGLLDVLRALQSV